MTTPCCPTYAMSAMTGMSALVSDGAAYAASFNGNTSNYFSRPAESAFDHEGLFSCAAWVKVPDVSGIKVIAGHLKPGVAAELDWFMKVDNSDFECLVYGAGGVAFSIGTIVGAIAANTWHFVCLSFNVNQGSSSEMTMFETDEGGSATDTDFTQRLTDNNSIGADFGVGRVDSGATAFNGLIGPVMYWKGLRITQANFEWLANGGVGRGFDQISSSGDAANPGTSGLLYWSFGDASNSSVRVDCGSSGKDLSMNGSVPRVEGHVLDVICV